MDVRKKRTDEEIARAKAEYEADLAIEHEYYVGLIDVAKSSIDRSRAAAETVQKAAGAIITLYTGALALSFSVSDRPLPLRGLYAALLLGVAVVLSTGFVAYLPDPGTYDDEDRSTNNDDLGESTPERLSNMFIKWSRTTSLDRVIWLRASVVALGVGLIFLPAPFISGHAAATNPPQQATWPTPDAAAGPNIQLQKILYKAQVERAATSNTVATEVTYDDQWLIGFIAALFLISIVPRVIRGRIAASQGASRVPTGA